MSQTDRLLVALKDELRRQRKTYAQAARVLDLSEASIKRLFSERNLSLQRLDTLCNWLGLEISDLVRGMEAGLERVSALTPAQEQELVADERLLLLTLCLLNHWRFKDIIAAYRISETEGIGMMGRLDQMGLIEILPGNRVRLLVAREFAWLRGGPIQRFFEGRIQNEFFDCSFDGPGECLLVVNGMLSSQSNADIIRRMRRLAAEVNERHTQDKNLPDNQRHGTTLVLAMRPWEAEVFQRLRREPGRKTFNAVAM